VNSDGPGFTLRDAHLRFPSNPRIPVFFSASGPKTLQLAGSMADGVVLLCGLFADGIQYALENVDIGADGAGRRRPHIAAFGYGAIDADEEAALAAARPIAAWFVQTVPKYAELAGLAPSIAEQVTALYGGGEFQEAEEAAGLLPDEYVRKMAFAGNQDHAMDKIESLVEAGVDSVSVFPLGKARQDTIRAFAASVEAYRQASK
jgi:5,10-methylenetetrahydromethanopterin reductase